MAISRHASARLTLVIERRGCCMEQVRLLSCVLFRSTSTVETTTWLTRLSPLPRLTGSSGTGKLPAAAERANYSMFLNELCDLIEVSRPDPAGPDDEKNAYVFERAVPFPNPDGSTTVKRIGLYKCDCLVLEAKRGTDRVEAPSLSGWGPIGGCAGEGPSGARRAGMRPCKRRTGKPSSTCAICRLPSITRHSSSWRMSATVGTVLSLLPLGPHVRSFPSPADPPAQAS